jgi:signal transduction histidine kinase
MGERRQRYWNSIHARLFVTYLLVAALGTTLMGSYIVWSFHQYFMRTRQADLESLTTAVGEGVADALEEQDLQKVDQIVQRFGAPATVTLRVFDPQGELISTSDPRDQQVTNWLQIPGMQQAQRSQLVRGVAKGVLSDEDRLYIARPIIRNNQLLGILRMSITLQQFQRQFATVIWTVIGTLLLTILLCALVSDRLARSLSRPVEKMRTFAMRMGSGHFGDTLLIRQSNELDQLAVELNRMSQRLASLDQERRAFLANVSHELRTPISNVQVTVEALKSGAYEEPDLRDRFFKTIEDETQRLSRLIRDLLDLGRLEAGVTQLEKQVISLPHLVERAVSAISSRAQSAQVAVQIEAADLKIEGDPERLLQAILNVLDNALKHSPPNSQILIAVQRQGKQAQLTIRDQGQGIADHDLPRIFEQFYTTDPSRKGSGVGLGLAIAKRIVEAHGGSITVNSKTHQGATFTLCLPYQPLAYSSLTR